MVDNVGQPLDDEAGDAVARVQTVEIPGQYSTHEPRMGSFHLQHSTGEPLAYAVSKLILDRQVADCRPLRLDLDRWRLVDPRIEENGRVSEG